MPSAEPTRNLLLAALPEDELRTLTPELEPVSLPACECHRVSRREYERLFGRSPTG